MPRIDLPPDSLGPKPTKKQMELLKKMATPGATVRTWSGVRMDSGGAYIDYHTEGAVNHEKVNQGDVGKFYDWGWLEHIDGDFRGQNYSVSDRARKVIQLGATR
jgi:hypothetical protein